MSRGNQKNCLRSMRQYNEEVTWLGWRRPLSGHLQRYSSSIFNYIMAFILIFATLVLRAPSPPPDFYRLDISNGIVANMNVNSRKHWLGQRTLRSSTTLKDHSHIASFTCIDNFSKTPVYQNIYNVSQKDAQIEQNHKTRSPLIWNICVFFCQN